LADRKGFLKDVLELFPEPKPHTNTISTILKILMEKGFVNYKTFGRQHEYFPLISKEITVGSLSEAWLKIILKGHIPMLFRFW
jgi:predicted transcriptional regulator